MSTIAVFYSAISTKAILYSAINTTALELISGSFSPVNFSIASRKSGVVSS